MTLSRRVMSSMTRKAAGPSARISRRLGGKSGSVACRSMNSPSRSTAARGPYSVWIVARRMAIPLGPGQADQSVQLMRQLHKRGGQRLVAQGYLGDKVVVEAEGGQLAHDGRPVDTPVKKRDEAVVGVEAVAGPTLIVLQVQ